MREILIAAQDALNTFMLAHHFGENRIPEIDIVGHGELALAAIGCIQRMATDGFHKIFQTGIEYREAVAVGGQHTLFFFMPWSGRRVMPLPTPTGIDDSLSSSIMKS